jgi:2-polyprenyl-6-methoxyphenol hydroxylase-like FAD-dependent oxidoreductase
MAQQNPTRVGSRLLILGGSIGGCFAAAALSAHFDETLIIEKDTLPDGPVLRAGVPQGSHIHGLLRRPLDIATRLLPGFEDDLLAAGALGLKAGIEGRFHDNGQWHPKRDLGIVNTAQSRPLIEHVLRGRVLALPNVKLRDRVALVDYLFQENTVVGAIVRNADGGDETIQADLVVDATGRTGPILSLLREHGYPAPEATELGVDIGYTSAFYTRRGPADDEAIGGYIIRSNPPRTRSGVLFPIEDDRWVVSLSGRFKDFPPHDDAGFQAFAATLEDPLLHNVLQREERVSPFTRFMIPRIHWRHYERLARFPDRLIPIGDTVTCFNPVYGQGMAVAAMHAEVLGELLLARAASAAPLSGLTGEALPQISRVSEWAWNMSEPVDLVYEQTVGPRPPGFEERIAFSKFVRSALPSEPELQWALNQVTNLLAPPSLLQETAARLGLLPSSTSKARPSHA